MTGVPLEYFFQGAPRLDDFPQNGFGETRQQPYQAEGELQNLAEVVAQRVSEHLPESVRRDLAAAAQAFSRKLGG